MEEKLSLKKIVAKIAQAGYAAIGRQQKKREKLPAVFTVKLHKK